MSEGSRGSQPRDGFLLGHCPRSSVAIAGANGSRECAPVNAATPIPFFVAWESGGQVPPALRTTISGQEFDAICLAATPKDFALLARRMIRHKRQYEHVTDIERGICRD